MSTRKLVTFLLLFALISQSIINFIGYNDTNKIIKLVFAILLAIFSVVMIVILIILKRKETINKK